ncbi:tail protein [Escherichia coli]|nr:tail protein [Escherichia coli]
MNEFKRFEDRLTGLIESLSPSGRRRLSAELAKRLRQSQQASGGWHRKPGTAHPTRHASSRAPEKRLVVLSEKCLRNLSPVVFLHIRASPEQASMEFYGGKSPKIASVHQFGLSEETRKDGKKLIIRRVLCSALPVRMCR